MSGETENQAGSGKGGKVILLAVIVFSVFALIYLSLKRTAPPDLTPLPRLSGGGVSARENLAAPDFIVQDLDGNEVSLSEFKDNVVIITFWSVGCPACLAQMEGLEILTQKMAGKPFQLMAVTADPARTIRSFMKRSYLNIPVFLDKTQQAHTKFGVFGLPATYIISGDGLVANNIVGAADWGHHTVIEYLEKLIKKSTPGQEQTL